MELVLALMQPALDRIPDQRRRIRPVELVDRDNSRRGGHVDLRQPLAADHVDADEDQPAFLELGPERRANLFLARREQRLRCRSADGEVRADFAFSRNTVDRARDLAVDEHDPFVALGNLRKELLQDVRLAVRAVEHFHERGEVAAIGADAKHRTAGKTVQRLQDDFALFGKELSLVMVGAILTIAGYSINDTIVVYDRIREGLHSGRKGSIQEIMNASINETLSRTLLTSLCTLLSVAALFFFGGPVLHDFAFAILIGIVVGTYSSIFIASPIVLWWSGHKGQSLRNEMDRTGGAGEGLSGATPPRLTA